MFMKLLEKIGILKIDEPLEYPEDKRAFRLYPLTDNRGQKYELVVDEEQPLEYWMRVVHQDPRRKHIVGQIQFGGVRGDTLILANLEIFHLQDRHKGLGTAMLHQLLDIARSNGIRRLTGFVVEKDIKATPGLLQWYEREGFTVRTNQSGTYADITTDIGSQTEHEMTDLRTPKR